MLQGCFYRAASRGLRQRVSVLQLDRDNRSCVPLKPFLKGVSQLLSLRAPPAWSPATKKRFRPRHGLRGMRATLVGGRGRKYCCHHAIWLLPAYRTRAAIADNLESSGSLKHPRFEDHPSPVPRCIRDSKSTHGCQLEILDASIHFLNSARDKAWLKLEHANDLRSWKLLLGSPIFERHYVPKT